eukprot:scaffold641_cov237-Pinguiococcus_pyrenoidosus.AAC.7
MAALDGLEAELAAVRELLPPAQILALRRDFVSVVLQRSRHNRLKVKVTLPEAYPEERLLLTLESDVLPPPLLRKLAREREESLAAAGGAPQIMLVVEELHRFLHANRFTTCWKEVRQVRAAQRRFSGALGALGDLQGVVLALKSVIFMGCLGSADGDGPRGAAGPGRELGIDHHSHCGGVARGGEARRKQGRQREGPGGLLSNASR